MVALYSLHHHFCCYVNLVGGDLFRVGELLDDEKGLFLYSSCGRVSYLVEVNRGLGIGGINGGWSRVVGYMSPDGGAVIGSPIWGISARRAL